MKCIHVISSLCVTAGGPSRSVTSLCDSLALISVDIGIISQINKQDESYGCLSPHNENVKQYKCKSYKYYRATITPHYYDILNDIVSRESYEIIHSHGLWLQCNHAAARIAAKRNIPHVVSTRGMLEPWAFKHRYWKKSPFWLLWQRRALQSSSILCATSDKEDRKSVV